MAFESATLHFSSTVIYEIGIVNHKKSQRNTDLSNDAADNEEVNSNPVGLSHKKSNRQKVKTFLKIFRSENSPHAWVLSPSSDEVVTKVSKNYNM